jgi:hypothetical protein
MAKAECLAALRMEMPRRIPRTEYSVEGHWDLLSAISGLSITQDSPETLKNQARLAYRRAWDVGFNWQVDISTGNIRGRRTDMGHAVYAAGGTDWRETQPCPFSTPEEVLAYDPNTEAGFTDHKELVRNFDERYAKTCAFDDQSVNMSGIYISMFSGLIEIFGWEMLLLAGGIDSAGLGQVALRYERWVSQFFNALAVCKSPVIMIHDDLTWTSGPVLAPAWYREFIFPAYHRLWRPILDAGKTIIFTCDGDYTEFFDDIVAAGAHSLVMEPCANMELFAKKYGKTHGFVGNVDTRALLSGPKDRIKAEVERCIHIGKDCPGFIMAVGNHIPSNTPVENALYYQEVFESLRNR